MKYKKMKRIIIAIIRKHKYRKYIRIITNKERAELTIETAIVFTIIMLIICSMIYFSLYLHDKVAIKSYAYSGLIESADKEESKVKTIINNKIKRAPLFVIRPSVSFSGDFNKYKCDISEKEHRSMSFINKILSLTVGNQHIEAVRKMPIDKMHLFKAIKDGIGK